MKDTRSCLLLSFGVGLLSLVLYGATLAPTVLWGDSAKYALYVHGRELSSAQGTHAYHIVHGIAWDGLWTSVAQMSGNLALATTGLAVRLHALSALMAAITLGLLAAMLWRMTRSAAAVITGAGALAVSHIFWSLSVVTETYTHFTCGIGVLLLAWEAWDRTGHRGWLILGAFGTGLCAGVNNLPGLYVPWLVVALLMRPLGRSRIGLVAVAVLACLVGFIFRGYLFYQDFARFQAEHQVEAEQAFRATWAQFADTAYHSQFFWMPGQQSAALKGLARFPLFLVYQFLVLTPVGLWGAWRLLRDRPALGLPLAGIVATLALFTSSYMEQRRFYIMVSVYQIFALWVGYGVWSIQRSLIRRGAWWKAEQWGLGLLLCAIAVPPAVYALVPGAADRFGIQLFKARAAPYRDNARFFLVPWKNGQGGAHRFAKEALDTAMPDGVIVADFTLHAPLEYVQKVEQRWGGVTLEGPVPPRMLQDIKTRWAGRRVFLADITERKAYGIDWLEGEYEFRQEGPIYEVVPKNR